MSFYRIKQFFWNFSYRLNKEEKEYLDRHLDESEINLLRKLSIGEQKHSIRVAVDAERISSKYIDKGIKVDKERLIVAALLHDIGKLNKRLNVIDKAVMVVLDKLTKGKLKKYDRLKKIDVYYNHAKKSADILKDCKYDKKIIYMVENHHKNIIDDIEMEILIKCDNMN